MQPIEGARVLVLSADPFAVEPLVAGLEEDGAEVVFRVALTDLPPPDSLDAVIVDQSATAFEPQALWPFLQSLPEHVLVLDGVQTARDMLNAHFVGDRPAGEGAVRAAAAEAEPVPAGRNGRLTRAAVTVTAVTAVLWLISRLQSPAADTLPAATPGAPGAAGQEGGSGQLAGRVTRAGSSEPLPNAAVVASGPSGSMSTITNAQGQWRFVNLRGGRYVVMTTAPRHVAKQQQVDVPEGRAVENVNFSLDPEAP